MKTKISVQEAWQIIQESSDCLASVKRSVESAVGCFASRDLAAPMDLPPFDNSAVDGYALASAGAAGESFQVVSTVGAGNYFAGALGLRDACRIMTGAKIPSGTRTVIMQEHVRSTGSAIVLDKSIALAENIRLAGDDVKSGVSVLQRGTRLTPAHVGLLSALGIAEVEVRARPTVAVISTGSELVDAGQPLGEGQVYYCTGPMMRSLCENSGVKVLSVAKIADDQEAIVAALKDALSADVVIMIGGMANGLYDHGRYAFDQVGVEPLFFEGQWRPGKPLFFGRHDRKLVFGVPGNPVASFVMFKIFVEPALRQMSGGSGELPWKQAHIVGKPPKASDKSQFLRARHVDGGVEILEGQGSHQLYTLSQADAIVWVQPSTLEAKYLALSLEKSC